jgi:hypothetical protein
MSMPLRPKRTDGRFQSDHERQEWHGADEHDQWENEDRHYIPGPRGPEADDFERRPHIPDEIDEDNVRQALVMNFRMLLFRLDLT